MFNDLVWIVAAVLLMVAAAWLGSRDEDGPTTQDSAGEDEYGFVPADKYGYGYGYSWQDPYGDKDL